MRKPGINPPIPGLALLVTVFLLGCGGDGQAPPDAQLQISMTPVDAGDGQSWSTGHTLPQPLRVQVTRGGVPEPAITVFWQPVDKGVVSPPLALTDSNGVAVTRFTLGTEARSYQIEAMLDSAAGSPVRFTATAFPNFKDQLKIVSGDSQSAPVNNPVPLLLSAFVGDQFSNPFPGAEVAWRVIQGDAVVGDTLSVSDVTGLVFAEVTFGSTPGPVDIVATWANAQTGPQITYHLMALPPGTP
ncbi:MAG: hypothetical protein AB7I33_05555 [Gemmatimonadales bacterium]